VSENREGTDALARCSEELLDFLGREGDEAAQAKVSAIAERCAAAGLLLYSRSPLLQSGRLLFLVRDGSEKVLVVAAQVGSVSGLPPEVTQTVGAGDGSLTLHICPCSNANATYLQREVAHLRPSANPGQAGFGAGDRIGLSTPGHVRALAGSAYFPLFAQQSIREMDRTARTPEDVMATAVWGILEEGYSGLWGADADHLKTRDDIERVSPFPYTMFTLDPSDVITDPETLSDEALRAAFRALPWEALRSSPEELLAEYTGSSETVTDRHGQHTAKLAFDEESIVRCAVKYSAGIARCAGLAALLDEKRSDRFDLEVSFDETDWPTSPLEHLFIASEFRRLEMRVDSLALRFPGAFEKGIDYRGDLAAFERDFAIHAAIRDTFNAYRLSIHSGSDKFSVYPIMTKHAGDKLHVKTAGTTYLEALRVLARRDAGLFGEILEFSHGRYAEDKRTYHVSADPTRMPKPAAIAPDQYESLLDDDGWRQVLHVAFGSVLTSGPEHDFRARLCAVLAAHEDDYYAALEKHFRKHLDALAEGLAGAS